MDTIFALATVPGRSGVAVIRISGSEAEAVCASLCGSVPKSRGLRQLHDPKTGQLLDEPLVLYFERGKSFTGESVIELHLHGSRAVVQEVLSVLSSMDGLRLADAGEFTRRALENGKLDLTEVEGLADLIDAETSAQHQQAIRVFSGELGNLADSWRADLIRAAALLEASIDFADEDVPEDVVPEVIGLMDRVSGSLRTQIEGVKAAERVRDGFEIAIVGKPNVGKSTLLNHLAGRTAAITSDIPGTTRDVIEVRMEIGGYAVTLSDTAGVRYAEDRIEQLGVDLALDRARQSDLNILLVSDDDDLDIAVRPQDIVVQAKADIVDATGLSVSGKTGKGIPQLIGLIEERLNGLVAGAGLAIRERHRVAMIKAEEALIEARRLLEEEGEFDIVAEELRFGLSKVSSIVGHVDVEDLLDEIFSSFCIGK